MCGFYSNVDCALRLRSVNLMIFHKQTGHESLFFHSSRSWQINARYLHVDLPISRLRNPSSPVCRGTW